MITRSAARTAEYLRHRASQTDDEYSRLDSAGSRNELPEGKDRNSEIGEKDQQCKVKNTRLMRLAQTSRPASSNAVTALTRDF
jgi:hypothetical protein